MDLGLKSDVTPEALELQRCLQEIERMQDVRLWLDADSRKRIMQRFEGAMANADWEAADAALAALLEAAKAAGDAERARAAASGFRSAAEVVARIERQPGLRLRLRDDGAIECVGGEPVEARLGLALRHFAQDARAYLAQRERAVVLVPRPEPAAG